MKNKSILLVEDNPDDEALTLRALRKNNIMNKVYIVHDGAEALDFLFATGPYKNRDPHDLPIVIFLDLKLPKVNGLEVLQQVRINQTTKLLPVVILTSSSEERDILNGYQLGANSYIRKPVDFEQFNKAVGQAGGYWLLLNEPVPGGINL
jgi:two-component system response regulator